MSDAAKTSPPIITIWETYGCGMEEVAAKLGEKLGIPVHKQAFSSEQIEAAEADRAKEGNFMRFVRRVGSMHVGDAVATTARAEQESWADMALENTKIVREEAAVGGVILGRNGAFILQNEPRSLHVKLDGHRTARARSAAQLKKIPVEQAIRRLPHEDAFRRDLSLRTYDFDPTQNEYYDLVLNEPKLGVDECVHLIVEAARDL